MAASVPAPIAMPRSAWASAAASFTPSPTRPTGIPSACRRRMASTLPSGPHLGEHVGGGDTELGRDRQGGAGVVAGQQDRAQAQAAQPGDGLARVRLELVGDHQRGPGLAVPADQDRGPALLLGGLGGLAQRRGHHEGQLGEQARAADGDHAAVDGAAHAGARAGR